MMEVRNLTTYYKTRMNEKVCSVDNVSFTLEDGKSLGVAGESGCGKSTLAMSVMGYYFPPLYYDSGSIIIDGKEITGLDPDVIRRTVLGSDIAYIPQSAMNALNPTRKIIHFIEDVLEAHGKGLSKRDIYDLARERFAVLNLPEKVLNQYAVELSGGMKQRTIIAISTILNPKVLIADEPSSALDVSSQKIVIKLLYELMEKGFVRSMIFITHELPLLFNVTDDIMVMYAGEIVERGTAKEMVFDPVMPYSKGLMNSIIVPEEGTRGHVLMAIPGAPPNLKIRPSGCRFAERCRFADPECSRETVCEQYGGAEGRTYRCRHKLEDLFQIYENDLPNLLDHDNINNNGAGNEKN
jgi:peptide/nickel transport system ATP-binding protein